MKFQALSVVAAALLFLSPQVDAGCSKSYKVLSGDTCWSIWTNHGLTESKFNSLNPDVNCSALPIGSKVCLASSSSSSTSSTTSTKSTSTGCKSYYQVKANDLCETISKKFGESTSKLTSDNPGIDCDDLNIGDVMCIGYGSGSLPRIPVPVTKCSEAGTFAITFDDGPYLYTDGLLDYLKANKLKSTFFINGNNYGNIYNYNATLRRMHTDGHQICHHTWSHPDISTLTLSQLEKEITELETAFKAILGFVPVYFRPPYGNTNLLSLQYLMQKGYKVIKWDVDDNDSLTDKPTTLQQDQKSFNSTLKAAGIHPKTDGHISLAHDPHPITAKDFAPWAFKTVKALGYKTMTVAECLGDTDPTNWYRTNPLK